MHQIGRAAGRERGLRLGLVWGAGGGLKKREEKKKEGGGREKEKQGEGEREK